MKAYYVYATNRDGMVIAFGDTPGQARRNALYCQEVFYDVPYVSTRARRCEEADEYYKKGKLYLDWDFPKDRIILADKFGFVCFDPDPSECEMCAAQEYCCWYQDNKEELANELR